MQLKDIKLYRPVQRILIPPAGYKGKNYCLISLNENCNFLDAFPYMGIKKNFVKYVFVPTTQRPRTRLTNDYRKELLGHGLRGVRGNFGNYTGLEGKNFYLDTNLYINSIIDLFNIERFNLGRAMMFMNSIINSFSSISPDLYERVLLYAVNLEKPIPTNIRTKRIYPVFDMLAEHAKLKTYPQNFERFILFFYDYSGGRFISLYEKGKPINAARIKIILTKLQIEKTEDIKKQENEEFIDDLVKVKKSETKEELKTNIKKEKIKDSIRTYVNSDPKLKNSELKNMIDNPEEKTRLAAASVAYHVTGNVEHARTIAKNSNPETSKKIIQKYSKDLIARPKIKSTSSMDIVRYSEPSDLVDDQVPTHILNKRKNDFKEVLKDDLVNVFKLLEKEELPIKVSNIEVKTIKEPVSELEQTIKDRYFIKLKDDKNKTHEVVFELPHLTDNGTFLINGQTRVLINQMINYPIVFPKPYEARLETVYAILSFWSKRLKTTSYLMIYLAGYKLPLMMVMNYAYGFKETCDLFKIKYKVFEEKPNIEENEKSQIIKIPDGRFIFFSFENESGRELVESFKYSMQYFPAQSNFEDKDFWTSALSKQTGTRNCINLINQIWKFIITPLEEQVLASKGDPTKLPQIIKYVCDKLVEGTVTDRNSVETQRLRTSEVFTHMIQKQVIAAYNEFLSKRLGGDENAKIDITPTKAWSEVINSQNVQLLESINPLEELAVMTRITPVGIGGIANSEAFPRKALNTHYTYYGNVDPLETPDGPSVGIQQHLTVGASLTNQRGLFAIKDRSTVDPTEILSVGPAMIPFVESDDGPRVCMGVGQTKQAVPLLNPENPAVQTGYESLLTPLLSDNFIKKSPIDGIVESIEPGVIIIKEKVTGNKISVDIKSRLLKSGSGKNGLSKFKPIIKVGQTVKPGQIIAEGSNIVNGIISNGLNLLTAYMPWRGYNYEDAIVVSESAAKKMVSVHIQEDRIILEEDDDIINIANIGDNLKKGDKLITYSKSLYDVESYHHLWTEGGIILNIEVYSNVPENQIPEKLKPIYKKFKDYFIKVNKKYPIGQFKEKKVKFEGILIKFVLEQRLKLNRGDKLNNRHGGKGVIGLIEKDENMPLTPWGERVECILNPVGVINRMNSGQICELHTGLIAKRLAELIEFQPRTKFLSLYQKVLLLMDGTKDKAYSKKLIQKLKSLGDSQYNRLRSQIIKGRFLPVIVTPFKSPKREDILNAIGILGLEPRYPLKIEVEGFKTKTSPVAVGYLFIQKLEPMSDKKLATRGVGPYVSKSLAATEGKRREGGQKFGEYDLYSTMAWDCPHVIDEIFGPLSSDHAAKNDMINSVIQTGGTELKRTKANPVKELHDQLMLAIHLEDD